MALGLDSFKNNAVVVEFLKDHDGVVVGTKVQMNNSVAQRLVAQGIVKILPDARTARNRMIDRGVGEER